MTPKSPIYGSVCVSADVEVGVYLFMCESVQCTVHTLLKSLQDDGCEKNPLKEIGKSAKGHFGCICGSRQQMALEARHLNIYKLVFDKKKTQ